MTACNRRRCRANELQGKGKLNKHKKSVKKNKKQQQTMALHFAARDEVIWLHAGTYTYTHTYVCMYLFKYCVVAVCGTIILLGSFSKSFARA